MLVYAETVAYPFETALTMPLVTVTTLGLEVYQFTPAVVDVSVNELPTYASCDDFERLTGVPFFTFTVQEPAKPLALAVMTAVPGPLAVTIPLESTEATKLFDDDQVTLGAS